MTRNPSILTQTPAELQVAFESESLARQRAAAEHRALLKTAAETSREALYTARRKHVKAVRKEWDEMTGKDLASRLRAVAPATDAQVESFAVQLNIAMCRLWPEAKSQSSYFKLFRLMDIDKSGLISFYELVKTARNTLSITEHEMSEHQLLCLWRCVDTDVDGNINGGEFLRLVKRGWPAFLREREKLSKGADLLRRPAWNPASHLPLDSPAWKQQALTIAEKNRIFIDAAKQEVSARTRDFEDAARRYEVQRKSWLKQRESLVQIQRREGLRKPLGSSRSAPARSLTSRGSAQHMGLA